MSNRNPYELDDEPGVEQVQPEAAPVAEPVDRGIQPVSKKSKKKMSPGMLAIIVLAVVVLIAINASAFMDGGQSDQSDSQRSATSATATPSGSAGTAVAMLDIPPPPPESAPETVTSPAQNSGIITSGLPPRRQPMPVMRQPVNDKNVVTPAERKMQHGVFAYDGGSGGGSGVVTSGAAGASPYEVVPASMGMPGGPGAAFAGLGMGGGNSATSRDSLASSLKSTPIEATAATVLPHPRMTLTKGHFIPCVLETAISSDLSGMVACRITEDVYSTTGDVVLLDRGTRLVGQYQGGMKQGQSRVFILWTRAETPQSVIVQLDSPATDSLGRTGVTGDIDRHFWQRFGGAILLSVIGDLGEYVANSASEGTDGDTNIDLSGTREAAQNSVTTVLEHTIDIPPTLTKNQGEMIRVFVARDLDFSTVYDLQVSQ